MRIYATIKTIVLVKVQKAFLKKTTQTNNTVTGINIYERYSTLTNTCEQRRSVKEGERVRKGGKEQKENENYTLMAEM